jgi:hypothetical protein
VGLDFIGETKTNIVHGLTVGYGFYSPSHRITVQEKFSGMTAGLNLPPGMKLPF